MSSVKADCGHLVEYGDTKPIKYMNTYCDECEDKTYNICYPCFEVYKEVGTILRKEKTV